MRNAVGPGSVDSSRVDVVPVRSLRRAPWNPRTISTSQMRRLQESLERDPQLLWSRPLLALADGTIYAGNMRYEAAASLPEAWRRQHFGDDGLPAVLEDIPLTQAKERGLRDNAQWGEWIEEDLAELLHGLEAKGVPLDILGFDSDELERLLALASQNAPADDDAFDPTPPQVAETRNGDIVLLGPHRLVCGDSRDPDVWHLLMSTEGVSDALAHAMWTDPPYGVDLQLRSPEHRMDRDKGKRTSGEPAFEGDRPADLAPLLSAVFPHADRWLKPGAPIYMTGPSGPMERVFLEEIERVGWHLASPGLVWVKNAFVPGRSDYHPQHEMVFYAWKPGAPHVWLNAADQASVFDDEPHLGKMTRHELMTLVKELRNERTTSVIREDKTRHNDLHPTMKPTGLIRRMLANSTRRGDLVLDPFAGSGSTLIAAQLLDRRVAAIELEPRFCDVIVRRWTALQPGNKAVRICRSERREVASETDAEGSPQ